MNVLTELFSNLRKKNSIHPPYIKNISFDINIAIDFDIGRNR